MASSPKRLVALALLLTALVPVLGACGSVPTTAPTAAPAAGGDRRADRPPSRPSAGVHPSARYNDALL
ncbi:MAG: hypothetical protein HGA45_20465 [Chloroflexales bacterium]|nr:hypothetical protein [Chloroflexales bacterium]